MGGARSTYGERRGAWRVLVGKPEGEKKIINPTRKLQDNIQTDLKEIRWYGVRWVDMAQDRDRWRTLVVTVMNHRVP
jgi:hypothetical protein